MFPRGICSARSILIGRIEASYPVQREVLGILLDDARCLGCRSRGRGLLGNKEPLILWRAYLGVDVGMVCAGG